MAHFSLAVFMLASILIRGLRFSMVAGRWRWYADPTNGEAKLSLPPRARSACRLNF
jgi:hypothetical protein